MVKLLALLLSGCACFGQAFTLQDTAFLGNVIPKTGTTPPTTNDFVDNYYPTNIAGYPVSAWWVVQNAITNTAGGITNIPDWSGNGYTLLGVGAIAVPTISNNWLNTRPIMVYPGGVNYTLLGNSTWTNDGTANPVTNIEFVVVAAANWNGTAAASDLLGDVNENGVLRRAITSGNIYFSGINGSVWPTNKWMVINAVQYPGSGSACRGSIYTNSIQVADTSKAIANWNGLYVGGRGSDGHVTGPWEIAEIIVYKTNLTTAIRSNVFNYLTNKYFLSP